MFRQSLLLTICITCFCTTTSRAQSDSSVIARLPDGPLKEVSGVAASLKYPGIYYVHNDSGDQPRFFAISKDGAMKGEYHFAGDTMHFRPVQDCEDIATGPGPVEGRSYIYLADIGDNAGMRFYIRIYRFEEPVLNNNTSGTLPAAAVTLKYPDDPKDAETILADPQDKVIYILSKRRDSVSVYMTPVDFGQQDTLVLQPAGKLFFEGRKKEKWLVSGAVSKDGQQVLLKTMNAVYYWQRKPKEHLYETLQRKPISLPYQSKGQEEAICFSQDGKGYIILAEGKQSPIRYFPIPLIKSITFAPFLNIRMTKTEEQIRKRSDNKCELCQSTDSLKVYEVPPHSNGNADDTILICDKCLQQIDKKAELDSNHWRCLSEAMWSEVPGVQVVSWRILSRLKNESWAMENLDMMYLSEENLAWAKATGDHDNDSSVQLHKDAFGNLLQNGDTVVLTKSLDVKGTSLNAKLGTVVKNIRLVEDNTEQIEGRIEGQVIVILTKYLRKQNSL